MNQVSESGRINSDSLLQVDMPLVTQDHIRPGFKMTATDINLTNLKSNQTKGSLIYSSDLSSDATELSSEKVCRPKIRLFHPTINYYAED